MTLGELRTVFVGVRQYEPTETNELLDFVQQRYVMGEICILQYRDLIRELEAMGARKPNYLVEEGIAQGNS
ncbi:YppF family protein [Ectobacillus funiculus]|uniref:YppF family protein n=1 Tax=Ectobacillus funiculus TaxID=137993 RepID=A0ABV5WAS3_9BACI